MIKSIEYKTEVYNKACKLTDFEQAKIIEEDIKDTLETLDRTFLCANEIGYDCQAFGIKANGEVAVFFDPSFSALEESEVIIEKDYETDKEFLLPRCAKATMFYKNSDGNIFSNSFEDQVAFVMQRGFDCVRGLHDSDYGLEIDPDFYEATEEEKAEIIKAYIENLKSLNQSLDEELSEAEETKELWQSYRFNRAKAKGEVEVEEVEDKPSRRVRRMMKKLLKQSTRKERINENRRNNKRKQAVQD